MPLALWLLLLPKTQPSARLVLPLRFALFCRVFCSASPHTPTLIYHIYDKVSHGRNPCAPCDTRRMGFVGAFFLNFLHFQLPPAPQRLRDHHHSYFPTLSFVF